jgi:hypothetical protein
MSYVLHLFAQTDVALLSITACGVGLNLTRANVALFGELNWSLGETTRNLLIIMTATKLSVTFTFHLFSRGGATGGGPHSQVVTYHYSY